jgi:hypothetical protein
MTPADRHAPSADSPPLDPFVLFVVLGVVDHLAESRNLVPQEPLHSELERLLGARSPVAGALQANPRIAPLHGDQLNVTAVRLQRRADLGQACLDLTHKLFGYPRCFSLHRLHSNASTGKTA